MRVEVMWIDTPQIEVTSKGVKYSSKLLVDKPVVWVPKSIYPDRITIDSFYDFLCERLPERTRGDIDFILKKYDVPEFLPVQMCRKSHGRNMTDFLWLRFDGEDLCYDDIRLR